MVRGYRCGHLGSRIAVSSMPAASTRWEWALTIRAQAACGSAKCSHSAANSWISGQPRSRTSPPAQLRKASKCKPIGSLHVVAWHQSQPAHASPPVPVTWRPCRNPETLSATVLTHCADEPLPPTGHRRGRCTSFHAGHITCYAAVRAASREARKPSKSRTYAARCRGLSHNGGGWVMDGAGNEHAGSLPAYRPRPAATAQY